MQTFLLSLACWVRFFLITSLKLPPEGLCDTQDVNSTANSDSVQSGSAAETRC